ncbi:S-layer homology domain-containing protein [Selenomonas dianae]|uniref:S-layer homology domain-containing protein n=1 Tax=Selenomonas dianae TaxID=135079 RepID=A0ABP3CSI7_9FIRM|nr:S-layer homology domain-containing protein [Selenomonas dianae]WLD82517.1 S-layer homology domain-containing protein [Selenomonas dianae]
MKKTLVSALSAALVVGAASTTFAAANPFSDVPRDHWAYDAVTQLAADGVVEGYGDGTYRGDRSITRYEMAQMTAKAMAKENMPVSDRALVDRLAAEFADELNNLGVRVANLEKHADMVKWEGVLEYTYTSSRFENSARDMKSGKNRKKVNADNLLFRLEPTAEVNDHWSVHARLEAETKMNKDAAWDVNEDKASSDDRVSLKRAWAEGDYTNFNVKFGKLEMLSAEAYAKPGALIFDREFSGAEVSFGKDLQVKLQAGRMNGGDELGNDPAANYQGAELQYNGRFTAGVGYYRMNSEGFAPMLKDRKHTMQIWGLNAAYRFDKNSFLSAAYAHSKDFRMVMADSMPNKSYQVTYEYKGAEPDDKGSWGAYVSYRQLAGASVAPTGDGAMEGTRGIEIGTEYTLMPNVVLSAKYFRGKDLYAKYLGINQDKASRIFGRVEFFF